MDYEQLHLDALNKIIKSQEKIIALLEEENNRLKTQPIYVPSTSPNTGTPQFPNPPNLQPFITYPGISPTNPWWGIFSPDRWNTVSGDNPTASTTTITTSSVEPLTSGETTRSWPPTPENLKSKKKKL